MRDRWARILCAALLLPAMASCGLLRRPNMSRTSEIARLNRPSHPLIIVHGFLGSKLRSVSSGKVVWGNMTNVLRGGDTDDLALPMEVPAAGGDIADTADDLEAYQIYDSLWGRQFYAVILASLKSAGGYQLGDIEHPRPGDDAFIFLYDWRRDNVESARRLAVAIERLKTALGRPAEKFDLLTHSQGGLIARYYIMYGGRDVLDDLDGSATSRPTMQGAANVNKVIMLGTPNRGSVESLKILHLGVKKFFRPMRPEVVFTMPAVYQMLPPKGARVFADLEGRPVDLDLYDPDTWMKEGWSIFSEKSQRRVSKNLTGNAETALRDHNERARQFLAYQLQRADRFHRALEARLESGPAVSYYAFGSDCIDTLRTALVAERRSGRELMFDEERLDDEMLEARLQPVLYGPGDGIVLMQSLLDLSEPHGGGASDVPVNFKSAFFVCEDHGVLANDTIFQNNLLYLLLWKGGSPPPPPAPPTGLAVSPAAQR